MDVPTAGSGRLNRHRRSLHRHHNTHGRRVAGDFGPGSVAVTCFETQLWNKPEGNTGNMELRIATSNDVEGCVAVLAMLPDSLTESSHDEVRAQMARQLAVVAEDESRVVGFTLARPRYECSAEIMFAAVLPSTRGRGVGTALLGRTLEVLSDDGVALVEVKTLDASAGYEPYVSTRTFWERRGFAQIDCIDPLPCWDAGNPSAIYVKALRKT